MLSVVLIVKDEARQLPSALASLGARLDVVVYDTGSTDATRDVAERGGARVFEGEWPDDFAAARTAAQEPARFDWVMRMDADELLHVPRGTAEEWLRHALACAEEREADVIYALRCYSATNIHWFPRLFRASRYRWAEPLHERIVPRSERRRVIAAGGALFLHQPSPRPRGYAEMAARHHSRRPADRHLCYYLARSLWEAGRWEEAIPVLQRFLDGPPDYRFHRAEAHRMLGQALAAEVPDTARRHMEEAACCDGVRAEAVVDLVNFLLARGARADARRWIRFGADARPPVERAPWGGVTWPYLLELPAWRSETWRALWRRAA